MPQKLSQPGRYPCLCGCGDVPKYAENKYVHGHNSRPQKFFPEERLKSFCKCGCGGSVKTGRDYVLGHHVRVKHPRAMLGRTGDRSSMFGRHHTPKSKALLSVAHMGIAKGRKLTVEHRKNIGLANTGRVYSSETIAKMKRSQKGKHAKGPESNLYGKHRQPSKKFVYKGVPMDSSYELRFSIACDAYLIPWRRCDEAERFHFEDEQGKFTYLPDFVICGGTIIETKGYVGPDTVRRIKALVKIGAKVLFLQEQELIDFERSGVLVAKEPISLLGE